MNTHTTLAYFVEDSVRHSLNVSNIVNGTFYTAEIEYYCIKGKWQPVDVVIPEIQEFYENKKEKLAQLQHILSSNNINMWYIHKIIRDLNNSMHDPLDTGFFCYRAVETIAKYFCHSMSATVKPRHITKMIEKLGIKRSDIEFIKQYSDPVRHGDAVPIPSETRSKIFNATWVVVDAFFEFAAREYDGIESSLEKDNAR